jgi:hypothetical protein
LSLPLRKLPFLQDKGEAYYLLGKSQSLRRGPWIFTMRMSSRRMLRSPEDSILKRGPAGWRFQNIEMTACCAQPILPAASVLDMRTGEKPATPFLAGNTKFLKSQMRTNGISSPQLWGRVSYWRHGLH